MNPPQISAYIMNPSASELQNCAKSDGSWNGLALLAS